MAGPSAATNFLSPEDYAQLLRQAEMENRAGLEMNQAPRHWTQALAGALNQGLSGYREGQARERYGATKAAGAQAMAALLRGDEGAFDAAMKIPGFEQQAMQFELGKPQRRLTQMRLDQESKIAPLELEKARLGNQRLQAQTATEQAKLAQMRNRASMITDFMTKNGIDPNSPVGMALITNGGKITPDVMKQLNKQEQQQQGGDRIAAGLKDIITKAEEAERDKSLTPAIGPLQGAEPDNIVEKGVAQVARLFGELDAWWSGAKRAPTEVRSNIMGGAKAIAQTMKRMVRTPGEGPWTDRDQADLDKLVGSMAEAKDLAELRRRANAVRDRIQANFDFKINFDAGEGGLPENKTSKANANIPAPAIDFLMKNPSAEVRRQFDAKYGKGASGRVLSGR